MQVTQEKQVGSLGQGDSLEKGMARQPTPAFLPAESHGQRSLVGYKSAGSQSPTELKRLSMNARVMNTGAEVGRASCCANIECGLGLLTRSSLVGHDEGEVTSHLSSGYMHSDFRLTRHPATLPSSCAHSEEACRHTERPVWQGAEGSLRPKPTNDGHPRANSRRWTESWQ